MNMYARDFFLFCMLITLLKFFVFSNAQPTERVTIQAESDKFSMHIPDYEDAKLLHQVKLLIDEIKILIKKTPAQNAHQGEQLMQELKKLEFIKENYTYISPGAILFGPFATVGLELKQKNFQQQVKKIARTVHCLKQTL